MTPSTQRFVPYKPPFYDIVWTFFPIAQGKQEETLFSMVTISRNNWNNCGDSTLKKKKQRIPTDGEGRVGRDGE